MDITIHTMRMSRRLDTRERILAAAAAELVERGSLRIGAVAARAGVSRQTLHHHVGSRADLAAALRAGGHVGSNAPEASTRERILDAVVEVLARPTGSSASLEAIAHAAGVTKGAIYHHFPDRASLLQETARRVSFTGDLLAALAADAATDRERLLALARVYEMAVRERAPVIGGLIALGRRDPSIVPLVAGELLGEAAPHLVRWVAERQRAGAFRAVPPVVVVQLLFAPILIRVLFGDSTIQILRQAVASAVPDAAGDDFTRAGVDLLVDGLAGAG